MAFAGVFVKLKRLRQRFGISAPKLAIKAHVAWYWRALASVAVLSVSFAAAAWVYDAGRRIAGFRSEESGREIEALRDKVIELNDELARLRAIAGSGESSLQIERTVQQQLALQVKTLEAENAALKQDLAFFEGLVPASGATAEAGIKINRLHVEPENNGEQYRYRMLLVHSGARQIKEFKGALQLVVKVQHGGKDVMITIPPENEQNLQRFRLEIRHFQRIEGAFSVPAGGVVKAVEARVLSDGVVLARQSVTL